jgi:hypothetical protein
MDVKYLADEYLRRSGAKISALDKRRLHDYLIETYMDNVRLWQSIVPQPITLDYVPGQPYEFYETMRDSMLGDAPTLLISTDFNESPLWGPTLNLLFRAMHDIDHVMFGFDFSFQGEVEVFRHSWRHHHHGDKRLWQQVLFSEVVAQAAVKETYGDFPAQKFVVFDAAYIDQWLKETP